MSESAENSARGRILVVDDEEMYAEMLYGILRQHHYATDMFTDSKQALEMILDNDYQLIVTDYQMPGLNGVQLVEKIRAADLAIPVIIISGMMHTPELQRAVNMGITSVLQKPTATSAFLSHVNKYLPQPAGHEIKSLISASESESAKENASKFEAETVFTFPSHLRHLTAHSEASKLTLQAMWDTSRSLNQIFFRIPQGGDALQFTWQLASWKGFDEVPMHFVNMADVRSPDNLEYLEMLSNSSKHSEIVVVDCQSSQIEDHLTSLETHIETAHQYVNGSRELTFVYWFSHSSWDTFLKLQSETVRNFCQANHIDIAPLNERLPDLAEYAIRLTQSFARRLKRAKRQEFAADAINLMLSTNWAGNYSQLSLALFKAVSIGSDGPITASELAKCISGERLETADSPLTRGGADQLKSFLCSIQNRFIRRSSKNSSIEIAPYYGPDEELLYPDLVSPDPEAAA